jgi:hypothetical protein
MPVQIGHQSFKLDQQDTDFIQLVNDRITSYGQIPYEVPQAMIISLIKECAKFFYKWYWGSSETMYGCVEKKWFNHYETGNWEKPKQPIASYVVQLPNAVKNVIEVFRRGDVQHNSSAYQAITESMQLINRQYSMSATGGFSLVGINNNLYMNEAISKLVENNVFESCCTAMVPFNFNIYTKNLMIHEEIKTDIVLKYLKNIHLHHLYDDDLFQKYVVVKCKKELKRVLGSHTIDLPGGVTLNVDEICDNIEEVDSIETQLKEGSGIGDIILWRH